MRSHFQLQINILEISLDILAIWHAGGEFANVPGNLVEVFKLQAVLRSAAGCSRLMRRKKVLSTHTGSTAKKQRKKRRTATE